MEEKPVAVTLLVEMWTEAYEALRDHCEKREVEPETFLSALGHLAVAVPDITRLVDEHLGLISRDDK